MEHSIQALIQALEEKYPLDTHSWERFKDNYYPYVDINRFDFESIYYGMLKQISVKDIEKPNIVWLPKEHKLDLIYCFLFFCWQDQKLPSLMRDTLEFGEKTEKEDHYIHVSPLEIFYNHFAFFAEQDIRSPELKNKLSFLYDLMWYNRLVFHAGMMFDLEGEFYIKGLEKYKFTSFFYYLLPLIISQKMDKESSLLIDFDSKNGRNSLMKWLFDVFTDYEFKNNIDIFKKIPFKYISVHSWEEITKVKHLLKFCPDLMVKIKEPLKALNVLHYEPEIPHLVCINKDIPVVDVVDYIDAGITNLTLEQSQSQLDWVKISFERCLKHETHHVKDTFFSFLSEHPKLEEYYFNHANRIE